MSNRFVRLAVTIGPAILLGVVLLGVGLPANFAFSVTISLMITGAFSFSRPSTSQVVTAPTSTEGETPSTHVVTTFTNVAFASEQPTRKRWREDVGAVTVTDQAITMDAKKKTLTIAAPFVAEVYDHKFSHWTMIRVKGRTVPCRQPRPTFARGAHRKQSLQSKPRS